MDEEIENIADNDVEVANPQETEEVAEQTEVQGEQEATEPVNETKAFAQRLKEQTQKAIDAEYERLYSEHGIKSKAEYDAAIEKQRIQQEAIERNYDPELYEKVVTMESELSKYRAEKTMAQQEEALSKDENFGAIFNEHKDEIKELANAFGGELRGNLDVATTLYIKNNFKTIVESQKQSAEQLAVQKIIQNQKTSPGSLSSGADNTKSSIDTLSKADFKALTEQVMRGERKSL